jgi:hypothetical protein
MDVLTHIIVALNAVANVIGRFVLAPIGYLPGWLSATIIGVVTGLLMLVAFKYTSNQRAIKRVRGDIRANLLALKLFKDSFPVVPRSLRRVMVGAGRLILLAIVPLLIMTPPMLLLLGQMSLWYQDRPLMVLPPEQVTSRVDLGGVGVEFRRNLGKKKWTRDQMEQLQKTTVTVKLKDSPDSSFPSVVLQPSSAFEVWVDPDIPPQLREGMTVGPVRVLSERTVSWDILAKENGYHRLTFVVDGQTFEKELASGDRLMRVSSMRPGWNWKDSLLNPAEKPFGPESPVQWISIEYPEREEWMSGKDSWVIWWFIVSFVTAFLFRGALKVNI